MNPYSDPGAPKTMFFRPTFTRRYFRSLLAASALLGALAGALAVWWLGKPAAGVEMVDVRCAVPDKPTPPVKAEIYLGPVAEFSPPPSGNLVSLQTEYTYVECKCPRRAR